MYADFLDESSHVIKEPRLSKVASQFRECGRQWSDIAKASMPDEWDSLAQARRLIVRKNDLFEKEGPNARDRIRKITEELGVELMRTINEEFESLDRRKADSLMNDLSGKIVELERSEAEAFASLRETIGNR